MGLMTGPAVSGGSGVAVPLVTERTVGSAVSPLERKTGAIVI